MKPTDSAFLRSLDERLRRLDEQLRRLDEERTLLLRLREVHATDATATSTSYAPKKHVRRARGRRPAVNLTPEEAVLSIVARYPKGITVSDLVSLAKERVDAPARSIDASLMAAANAMAERGDDIEKHDGLFFPRR